MNPTPAAPPSLSPRALHRFNMVKKKPQSKRMPARKKYKIEKKVKEHRRKVRKEERKRGDSRKKMKKDPGIPNLYPFKEQTLKQLKEQKEREIESQKRQKEARKKEQAKRRSLQGLRADIERRTKAFEKKNSHQQKETDQNQLNAVQSTKRFYKEFKKIVDAADVVLEILDARDPMGCRCPQMEQKILASGTNKKLILVLNKIDLVPRENVKKWLKYLRNEFPTVAFKSSTQSQKHNLSRKKFALESGPVSMEQSSVCLGSEALMKMLGNYSRSLSLKTSITVGVVGLPNVGKSSVINSLKRSRVCNVGSVAGITKTVQKVKLDSHIELLDSPGIVLGGEATGSDHRLALRNCMKVELLTDLVSPVESVISRCDSIEVTKHYCITPYKGVMEFLTLLAKKMGKLKKGGIPDTDAAARVVLHDWNTGRINFFTQPPERLPSDMASDIVKEWGKAFDMPSISSMEEDLLSGLSNKLKNTLVIDPSEPVELMVEEESETEEESEIEEVMTDEMSSSDDEEQMEEDGATDNVVVKMKPSKNRQQLEVSAFKEQEDDSYDFSSLV